MLRRTRVATSPDMVRMSKAISRPGIDPRIWCCRAYASADSKLDKKHGEFVDVVLLPSQLEVTVQVPNAYAGKKFGTKYGSILKDDVVLVLFPDGDASSGGFVIARSWSEADTPSELANNNPDDVTMVLADDVSFRAKLGGNGVINVELEGDVNLKTTKKFQAEADTATLKSGNVRLGDENATEPVILGTTYRNAEDQLLSQLQSAASQLTAAGGQLTGAGAAMSVPISGAVAAGPQVSAAGAQVLAAATTITAAVNAFTAQASTYVSTVSKTK